MTVLALYELVARYTRSGPYSSSLLRRGLCLSGFLSMRKLSRRKPPAEVLTSSCSTRNRGGPSVTLLGHAVKPCGCFVLEKYQRKGEGGVGRVRNPEAPK